MILRSKALFFVHQIDVKRVSISKRTPTYFSFVSRQGSSHVASQKHHESANWNMLQSLSSLIWFIVPCKYTKDGNLVSDQILEKVQPGAALSQSSRYLSFFPRTSQVISSGHQFSERDELLSEVYPR